MNRLSTSSRTGQRSRNGVYLRHRASIRPTIHHIGQMTYESRVGQRLLQSRGRSNDVCAARHTVQNSSRCLTPTLCRRVRVTC